MSNRPDYCRLARTICNSIRPCSAGVSGPFPAKGCPYRSWIGVRVSLSKLAGLRTLCWLSLMPHGYCFTLVFILITIGKYICLGNLIAEGLICSSWGPKCYYFNPSAILSNYCYKEICTTLLIFCNFLIKQGGIVFLKSNPWTGIRSKSLVNA